MIDYIVKIEGNEALLEQFIDAIESEKCKIAEKYPNPYMLQTGEKVLNSTVLECKDNLESYFTAEELEDMEESGNDMNEMTVWIWEHILYTTFGERKKRDKLLKEASGELKECYIQLFDNKR